MRRSICTVVSNHLNNVVIASLVSHVLMLKQHEMMFVLLHFEQIVRVMPVFMFLCSWHGVWSFPFYVNAELFFLHLLVNYSP
jgi:hypothetical protein